MTPAIPPNANVVYKAPEDWDSSVNGPCLDLHVIKHINTISSIWLPSAEELQMLNEGGYVLLIVHGNSLPAVALSTVKLEKATQNNVDERGNQQTG